MIDVSSDFTLFNSALFKERLGIELDEIASAIEKEGENNHNLFPISEEPIVIEQSRKEGYPTARVGQKYIHSKYDPLGEAEKIISTAFDNYFDCFIIGGFGLGYHLEKFLELDKTGKIKVIVVEPDISFLKAAAKVRSLEKVINPEQVYYLFASPPEAVASLLGSLQCEKIKYFQLRSEWELNKEYFGQVQKSITEYVARKEINNNTLNRFGKLWVKNLSANLSEFSLSPALIHLKELFKNIPALIIAGGPGLDEVLPFLKQLRERFLLIAVDTSFRACLNAGVSPDFVTVVDPQYWNFRHLDRVKELTATLPGNNAMPFLISEPSTYSGVFRLFPEGKFYAGSVFPLGKHFEKITFNRGKIGAGGSVATSTWDFARQAGCSRAVFAGLDLAYPGKQTHFKGSFFEERAHTRSLRTHPASDMDFALITDAQPFLTERAAGGMVLTDKRLELYKNWFKEQLKIHSFKTETLSADGVKIEGIIVTKLSALLEEPIVRPELEKQLKTLRQFATDYRGQEGAATVKKTTLGVTSLLERMEELLHPATAGKKAAEMLLTLYSGKNIIPKNLPLKEREQIATFFEALDNADMEILSFSQRNVAGFLLQNTIRTITEDIKEKDFDSVIKRSFKIYFELEESILLHIKYLRAFLKTA